MIPDPRWLAALKYLPSKTVAGLFLALLLLLILNLLGIVPLAAFNALLPIRNRACVTPTMPNNSHHG